MVRPKSTLYLWALPLLFMAVFYMYPLIAILRLTIGYARDNGLAGSLGVQLLSPQLLRPLGFTLWQASLSTILTLLVGLPAAFVFARYRFPGKRLLNVLFTLPFILPTVVAAASFNALLGPHGWVNVLLMQMFNLPMPPLNLMNTLSIILLAHVFYNTAVVIRVVGTAWSQLNPRLEQAGRVLGASALRTWWEVILPLLRPAIAAAGLLVFLFDFTSFGVILLLGGPTYATLEVEIYIQALNMLNLPLAGLLSLVQMAGTLLLTVAYLRLGQMPGVATSGVSLAPQATLMPRLQDEAARQPRRWDEYLLVFGFSTLLLVLLVSPLAALALRSVSNLEGSGGGLTLAYYRELFINRRQSLFYAPPVNAVVNSLLYATATVGISIVLGMLVVYALNRPSKANRLAELLIMLPLGTSAVTLGLGFILVFNHPPIDIRSFPLLIPIAHSLVALPVVVSILRPALASVPANLRQAAAVLGATPWQVWWEVDLPVMARAARNAAIFAFTISLGEFGATSFLTRPEYPTMPIAISRFLSQPGALNYGQALAMATILMVVCAVSILLIERN